MTNFSLRSARKCAVASVLALLIAGCGSDDGQQDLAEAEEALAARDFVTAEKAVRKSLEAAPENVDVLVTAIRLRLAQDQNAEAESLVQRAMALAGGDTDVLFLDAQCAYRQQDYERALGDYRKILSGDGVTDEIRSQALCGIGAVKMTGNDFEAARVALLQAIRADRRNAAAHYHLGYLYRSSYAYLEEALAEYDIFVRLETLDGERVRRVQRTVIPDIRAEIANQAAQRPGATKRNTAVSAQALAKAETLAKPGPKQSWKAARAAYQEACTADVLSYPAALGLAQAIERTDSTPAGREAALKAYRTACVLRPSASKTLLKTGDLALRLDKPLIAVECYSRAIAANPNDVGAVDGLIRALRKAGRPADADVYQRYRNSLTRKK